MRVHKFEALMWSIAFPGFGQLLNRHYLKGLLLVLLEFWINVRSHLNTAIIASFHGQTLASVEQADFQWLMFYPCVYLFGVWDAYKFAGGDRSPYDYLPFVFSAYIGTIGVVYSSSLKVTGVVLGTVWLPIFCLIIGAIIGGVIRGLLVLKMKKPG